MRSCICARSPVRRGREALKLGDEKMKVGQSAPEPGKELGHCRILDGSRCSERLRTQRSSQYLVKHKRRATTVRQACPFFNGRVVNAHEMETQAAISAWDPFEIEISLVPCIAD